MVRYTNNKYDLTRKQEVTIHSDALLSSGVFKISFQFWFLHLFKFACNKYLLDFLSTFAVAESLWKFSVNNYLNRKQKKRFCMRMSKPNNFELSECFAFFDIACTFQVIATL